MSYVRLTIRLVCWLLLCTHADFALSNSPWETRPFPEKLQEFKHYSIAFSASDLSNPESTFGHVFLVLHNKRLPQANDPTIEFYGLTEQSPAALIHTVTDHISGVYKVSTWAQKLRTYGQESRDIYIREIDKPVGISEVVSRLRNAWNIIWNYDYLNQNCAYYLERLIISNPKALDKSWAIRQPLDVFLNYGNPNRERVYKSAVRLKAEYQQVLNTYPNSTALQMGVKYYDARETVWMMAANSNLNEAANYLMHHKAPKSLFKAPNLNAPRRLFKAEIFSHGSAFSFSGYDTQGLNESDPIFRYSDMHVGKVTLRCENGQTCSQHIDLFQVDSLAKEGIAKYLHGSVRHQRGLAANFQIGLGHGIAGNNWAGALLPILGFDTNAGLKIGFKSRIKGRLGDFVVLASSLSNASIEPARLSRTKIQIRPIEGGFELNFAVHQGFGLAYSHQF